MISFGPLSSTPISAIDGTAAEVVTVSRYASRLDLPTPRPAQILGAILAGFCFSPVFVTLEVNSVDKWQRPLELPPHHRVVPRFQHPFSFAVADPTESRVDRWQTPLQTPRLEKPSLSQAHLLFTHDARQSVPETRVDKFWQPLQLPTRRAPALLDALKPEVFAVFSDPFGENVKISAWYTPLSLPVRAKPSPIPPFSFAVTRSIVTTQTVDQWYTPLSQPYYVVSLSPALIPVASTYVDTTGTIVVVVDNNITSVPNPLGLVAKVIVANSNIIASTTAITSITTTPASLTNITTNDPIDSDVTT